MTSSYNDTEQNQAAAAGNTSAYADKPLPKFFTENPVNFEITNNEYSSAPYYYDYTRNSWIFYKPGTDIPNPPLDPSRGNLWIDPTNMYLMYVYNENEMSFPDAEEQRWYALTTNKRAYDYLIVPTSLNGDNITTIRPPDSVDIFKQAYLYFNRQDVDLKVKVGEEGGVTSTWSSITQRAIEGVEDPNADFNDVLPASAIRQLQGSINTLEKKVEKLKTDLGL